MWKTKAICVSLLLLCVVSLSEAVNSKEQNFSQSLASSALNVTTTFATTDAGFLSVVSLHFSAAPASAETIKIYRDSRAGTNFDSLVASYTTIAGTTTDVAFLVGNAIPIAETDQVRVTCTNASAANTVYVSVVLDTAPRGSGSISVYDNGALKISALQHDYHWHFGDVLPDANQALGSYYFDLSALAAPASPASGTRRLYLDSGSGELSVRTSAGTTVSLEAAGTGHTVEDEGTPLTTRTLLDFTGGGITCSDSGTSTQCDVPSGGAGAHEIDDEGSALAQEAVLNFTGTGVTCTAGVGQTICNIPQVTAIHVVTATASFADAGQDSVSTAVTGETWVTTTSRIACVPTAVATADRGEGEEDALLEGLESVVHTRVNADGFTIATKPRDGYAHGDYVVHCVGA